METMYVYHGRLCSHMWQSQVEIEHYSVVYFECIKALECRTFVKGGIYMCWVNS